MNLIVKKLIQLNNCFLNKDEKNFILSLKNKIKFIDKKKGLINNECFTFFFYQLFDHSKIFWIINLMAFGLIQWWEDQKIYLDLFLIKLDFSLCFIVFKWSKLYKAIGIERTFNISQIDISNYQRKQSYKYKFFLKKKKKF